MEYTKIDELIGKNIVDVYVSESKDELILTDDNQIKYKFFHMQECCESVFIEEIFGDLNDFIGTIVDAEECSSNTLEDQISPPDSYESNTWTFYRFSIAGKGTVVVRWLGTSNGYYSESVHFDVINP